MSVLAHELSDGHASLLSDPGNPALLDQIGAGFLKAQDAEKARQFLMRALVAGPPQSAEISFRLAISLEASGLFEGAAQHYLEAGAGMDGKRGRECHYRAFGCLQRLEAANKISEIAEDLSPFGWEGFSGMHETVGLSHLMAGRHESALVWLYAKPVDRDTEREYEKLLTHVRGQLEGKLSSDAFSRLFLRLGHDLSRMMQRTETLLYWAGRELGVSGLFEVVAKGSLLENTGGQCAPVLFKVLHLRRGYEDLALLWAKRTLVQFPLFGRALAPIIPEERAFEDPETHTKSNSIWARAAIITPNSNAAETNNAVIALKSVDEAHPCPSEYFLRAANRFPDNPIIQYNSGAFLNERAEAEDAEPMLKRAILVNPSYAKALSAYSVSQCIMLRRGTGVAAAKRALAANPLLGSAYSNWAIALRGDGDISAAIEVSKRGLRDSPDDAVMRMGLAFNQLTIGAIEHGFENFLCRWAQKGFPSDKRPFPQKEWRGEKIPADKKIVVYMEQGLGDEFMYSWFLRYLDEQAPGQIRVECDQRLVPILARSFPSISFFAKAVPIHKDGLAPDVMYKVPIGHLPHYFTPKMRALILDRWAMALEEVVRGHGWIEADPERVKYWREYLKDKGGENRLVVGVAWRSALLARARRLQYVEPRELIAALPDGCIAVNLQYVYDDEEIAEIHRLAEPRGIDFLTIPDLDLKDDLDDVVALTVALDALATPLTSTAFIGGAVGTPTFVFRSSASFNVWQQLGTPHIPWLPAIKIFFRDPRDSWDHVADAVRARLQSLIPHKSSLHSSTN